MHKCILVSTLHHKDPTNSLQGGYSGACLFLILSRLDYLRFVPWGSSLCAIHPMQLIKNADARLVFNLPNFFHIMSLQPASKQMSPQPTGRHSSITVLHSMPFEPQVQLNLILVFHIRLKTHLFNKHSLNEHSFKNTAFVAVPHFPNNFLSYRVIPW